MLPGQGHGFELNPCGSLSLSLFYTQTQLSYLWQHFRSSIISHYPQFQSTFQPQTQTLFFFWIQVETYSHRRDRISRYLNQKTRTHNMNHIIS